MRIRKNHKSCNDKVILGKYLSPKLPKISSMEENDTVNQTFRKKLFNEFVEVETERWRLKEKHSFSVCSK